ncbi:CASP-like protein 4B4 [Carex littledalei]|uniref:CASP-like protein n=1 Tax=Carex littledalei TaxID=544730 RepID=A0A833VRC0_9POAL|nr:CASP-like protein 4B4 [Carex littledalei]
MATAVDGKANGLPPPLPLHIASRDGGGRAATSVVRRWKNEDLLEKSPLVLRALAALFSFISFILLVSNKHGDWMEFDHFQEYRYLVAISLLAFVYSLVQSLRPLFYRIRASVDPTTARLPGIGDFIGDQVVAYLLISALSAAIPITNRMRRAVVNIFTDSTTASISMAFLAFVALAFSALSTGFKLSRQFYI